MRFEIQQMGSTSSTNDAALRLASKGAGEGLVIWSLRQTEGRGRQGRPWESPTGNLYFSVILEPPLPVRDWGRYSFVAALALAKSLQELLPPKTVQLKWPNDVLVNGRKVAGILLEAGKDHLVCGIGVNVRHAPDRVLYPCTSLEAENARVLPMDVLLKQILKDLNHWYGILNKTGFGRIRSAWLASARKGPVRVKLEKGEIKGDFADLDADGNLRVLLKDGTMKSVRTGDVFF